LYIDILEVKIVLIVVSEYIVSFDGYYKASARKRFISAALQETGSTWSVLPRLNPAHNYPSDFDVVQVRVFCA
jgi:membrane-bound transcription factor site-1 protease